ncbi:type II secretion system ATPase GspE [Desulfofundulus thermocisternus]|uniref:type II secretion system ATPase GspE n=1 Tax=Desulfofundulus thermocisternus TaxID=42471 RepID=UPI00217EE68E|nr:type II secretion system ATPase GspE [Desulfofundulus thermocisternus]MCS5694825.1 type II secretion system ATPase GspE [Desulfofundulus thermocisternus]
MTRRKLLGERLVEEGLITQEQLGEALRVQARTGELLGQVLVKLGMVSPQDLNRVLAADGVIVDDRKVVDPQLLKIVPESLIRRYRLFPLRKSGRRLLVAMTEPLNVVAIDDLRLVTGLDIEPVVANEKEINALIERHLGFPEVEKALQEMGPEQAPEEDAGEIVVDEAPIIQLVNAIIMRALDEEASDIHIEPFEKDIRVRYRVDGLLREVMRLPRRMSQAVVSRIKIMASMDIAERRLPQDGRILLKLPGRDLDLRVSTIPTLFGEKVVVRILDKESIKNLSLENLGFSPANLKVFRNFLRSSYGMILVTGPTGSGKTTTLYAALNAINSVETNIVTVEDPVEYVLEGVNQAQVNVKAGATFATYLRSILRQDPDVIMVGEIRDLETAEIAVRAATTGHLVLSTLHTNDAPGALTRLVDMGIEPFMVASSVLGVVAQRLVRRVCPGCRAPYEPREAELSFAGPGMQSAQLFAGRGCEHCNHTGYRGRIAVHEVLVVTPALQRLILKGVSTEELRREALRQGMVSLKEDGLRKVREGITTIAEIMRVAFREEKL